MPQTTKIMTAVDLSGFSSATVRYSVWLAKKLNAELVMVSVINQRELEMVQWPMLSNAHTVSIVDYIDSQVKARKIEMKALFEAASPDPVQCRYLVRNGIPHQELLAAIKEEKPQLLVLGTKGRSNITDVVIGSTARRMFSRSPIPLVILPAEYEQMPS